MITTLIVLLVLAAILCIAWTVYRQENSTSWRRNSKRFPSIWTRGPTA